MKKIEDMTIFELKEFREILIMLKNKYSKNVALDVCGYEAFYDKNDIATCHHELASKFNQVQKILEKVDKIIEKMVLEEYV